MIEMTCEIQNSIFQYYEFDSNKIVIYLAQKVRKVDESRRKIKSMGHQIVKVNSI